MGSRPQSRKNLPTPAGWTLGFGQFEIRPKEVAVNAKSILKRVRAEPKVDILIFAEMSLTGYLLGDLWENPSFLTECEKWGEEIIAASGRTVLVFGNVAVDWNKVNEDGRPRKYNTAVVAQNGKALIHPGTQLPYSIKTLLPNYREFDDSRHFYDMGKWCRENGKKIEACLQPLQVKTSKGTLPLAVSICEDAWSGDYSLSPMDIQTKNGARLLINISCSPYTRGKQSKKHGVFSALSRRLQRPIATINAMGIQNNGKNVFSFDGSAAYYSEKGVLQFLAPKYRSQLFRHVIGEKTTARVVENKEDIAEVYRAIAFGVKGFLAASGRDRVVIGISGGIDSAVAAALYASLLPPEKILLVNMPGPFTGPTTQKLARRLAKNLDCYYLELPIDSAVSLTEKQLRTKARIPASGKNFSLKLNSLAMENIQARDRGSRLLAAAASSFGGLISCNANKAEAMVGYATLYGDLIGYLAVLGDLWKEDVYLLGRYLNEKSGREIIPENIFEIKASAELSPSQRVEKNQGDPLHYPYHDKLFFSWIQRWNRVTPEEILEWYLGGTLSRELELKENALESLFSTPAEFVEDLERWWNLYQGMGAVKRVQAPPILSLSSRALGFDHRETIGPAFYSFRYFELKKKVLTQSRKAALNFR